MRVLFIGGTGIISTACTRLAAELGIDLTLLTRGRRAAALPAGAKTLTVDIAGTPAAARAPQPLLLRWSRGSRQRPPISNETWNCFDAARGSPSSSAPPAPTKSRRL